MLHLKLKRVKLGDGSIKIFDSKKRSSPAQFFNKKDLYSTFFGAVVNDDIEKRKFGPIDHNGAEAVKARL